jgi:hypothetical protein
VLGEYILPVYYFMTKYLNYTSTLEPETWRKTERP